MDHDVRPFISGRFHYRGYTTKSSNNRTDSRRIEVGRLRSRSNVEHGSEATTSELMPLYPVIRATDKRKKTVDRILQRSMCFRKEADLPIRGISKYQSRSTTFLRPRTWMRYGINGNHVVDLRGIPLLPVDFFSRSQDFVLERNSLIPGRPTFPP